jgi:Domain of unknown function (DUF222)/HNH endonuclease
LDTGAPISAAILRRWACDARILPVVYNSAGAVLDVGQERRLFTGALRRALIARDGGCTFPGCDRPPSWCGHHIISWIDGGPTSLENAALLCGHHHRVIHAGAWMTRLGPDRHPEFVPPPHIDPARLPRRNHYHRRP